MSDIKTILVDRRGRFDWRLLGPSLEQDDGLLTAISLMLFCDRRALPDDELPTPDSGRRGWPGDSLAMPQGMQLGSRLWLLFRSKQTQDTLNRAREYAVEALTPLRTLGKVDRIEVEAIVVRFEVMGLLVNVYAPQGREERLRFEIEMG